ncbi:hypothetical protein PPERSA_09669 [Pseudocohnilembus persalinus]|uniref:Transmembrane protein n=1 Tax=Pseudocohnilembus persalinus TaxID=266149 RepID=A0A0V0R6Z3_PSEPJ|nr:hypothetical protein PPERSA_09669 [Pseudocohnilembus persalinus]|eukprot:KRX10285.1 hypothetical protein PPERSA_09669 [Pseudocohnilembus persalinus]
MKNQIDEQNLRNQLKQVNKEQVALIFIGFSFSYIIQYYIPLRVLVCVGIILIGVTFLSYQYFQKVKNKNALINWSQKWQNLLLERSLFDIIADIWYIPGISRYIKAFLKPFFYNIPPEQAIQQFEDINPQFKNSMTRKGSQYVSSHEKKNLIRACVLTGIYIGANLYFRQKSRQQLKKIVFISISIIAYAICAGSFLLLTTHHSKKNTRKKQQSLTDLNIIENQTQNGSEDDMYYRILTQ